MSSRIPPHPDSRAQMEHQPSPLAGGGDARSLGPELVRESLHGVALFEGLGAQDFDEILAVAEPVLVEADEYLFEQGDRGDHFYVIVRGEIELRKGTGNGTARLALLGAGQAFGEMSLLNQTPRSASAYALSDTYMLSVSREAFRTMLGGDSLPVRLLRNLSRSLWDKSVRMAARQAEQARSDTPHEALADFNRLLRARLLPRVTPRVGGYDLAASTAAPRWGTGSSSWDWFLLGDGRPVFVVMKSVRDDVFSAQRLETLRTVLRSASAEPRASLGVLMTLGSRGIRAGWVDGLSGPVACGMVALAEGGVEWAVAGDVAGMLVRSGGASRYLDRGAPPAGETPDHEYDSTVLELGVGDRLICMSHDPPSLAQVVTSVVVEGYSWSCRDALSKLFGALGGEPAGAGAGSDLTGIVIAPTRASG